MVTVTAEAAKWLVRHRGSYVFRSGWGSRTDHDCLIFSMLVLKMLGLFVRPCACICILGTLPSQQVLTGAETRSDTANTKAVASMCSSNVYARSRSALALRTQEHWERTGESGRVLAAGAGIVLWDDLQTLS